VLVGLALASAGCWLVNAAGKQVATEIGQ
jgi:hypothetical protein